MCSAAVCWLWCGLRMCQEVAAAVRLSGSVRLWLSEL